MERFTGDGWLMIGDAAFFVDPIFSSGVGDALHSAKFAAEAIIPALADNNLSSASFQDFERRMRLGVNVWQDFVRLFYKMAPIFSQVINTSEHSAQMMRICEGEVYDETARQAVEKLSGAFEAIQADPNHSLNRILKDLTPV